MPRTTPARNAIIGAAQGANAVLSAQIQAAKLKQQKQLAMYQQFIDRQKLDLQQQQIDVDLEQIQAQRDIASGKLNADPLDALRKSAAATIQLKGWDAASEEDKALVLGSAYDNYAKVKGLMSGATRRESLLDIKTDQAFQAQYALGNIQDEEFVRWLDVKRQDEDDPFWQIFNTLLAVTPEDRSEKQTVMESGLPKEKTVKIPRSAAERYNEALNLAQEAQQAGVSPDATPAWARRRLGIDMTLPEEEEEPTSDEYLESPEALEARIKYLEQKYPGNR